jgi:predicted PP-loop superfamily ATPase
LSDAGRGWGSVSKLEPSCIGKFLAAVAGMQLENDGHDDDERLLQSVGAAFRACSPDQRKIGLAVSGGSDSMAMLHLFARLAEAQGFELSAATVDHGLRDEAVEEAQLVAKTCEGL